MGSGSRRGLSRIWVRGHCDGVRLRASLGGTHQPCRHHSILVCAGAAAATLALRAALGPVGNLGATLPALPTLAAFSIEWLLSFGVMFVIMAVATDPRVRDGFAPIAVGLSVGFCALMGGPLTGASMNPARSFGPALIGNLWRAHWIYWLAPITGMMTAARLYEFLRRAEAPATQNGALGVQGPISRMEQTRIV